MVSCIHVYHTLRDTQSELRNLLSRRRLISRETTLNPKP